LVACLALPFAGCLLLSGYGDLGDYGAATGDDAPPAETAPSDAAADASPTVDSPVAHSDVSADDSASPFCTRLSPPPLFCDDFDENPVSYDWTNQYVTHGSISLDSDASVSPPNSFLSQLDRGDAADQGVADLVRFYTSPSVEEVHYAFDVRAELMDDAGAARARVAGVYVSTSLPYQFGVDLYSGLGYAYAEEERPYPDAAVTTQDFLLSRQLLVGRWAHVQMDLILSPDGGTATCTITIDGAVVLDAQPLSPGWEPGPPTIALGLGFTVNSRGAWAFRYDNVTLSVK
jgi:hypothetical protein